MNHFRCDGFKDSVVHVGFSHKGRYLAAADMSGVVKVWDVETKKVVWEQEISDITVSARVAAFIS